MMMPTPPAVTSARPRTRRSEVARRGRLVTTWRECGRPRGAASCALPPRPRHVLESEAGDALVLVGQALELGLADVAIEVVEGPVADQLLHAADQVVGRVLAVRPHHAR